MTTGQRIAQERKELGLSQEKLGEALGVSRQTVYKWEADAALPEIDKLVALSRTFSVTVGWLLGVEDAAPEKDAPEVELTEAQLDMVEEIVERYLAALPAPRRWPRVVGGCALLVLAVMLASLFVRLDRVSGNYNSLQDTLSRMDRDLSFQIGSIGGQVESILKEQDQTTASFAVELAAADLAADTVTFAARAVPRTYTEGMTAVFLADSGDGPAEFPAELGPGNEFSAEVTCPLTDQIVVSVVFADGEQRQTRVLDSFTDLLSSSFPQANIEDTLLMYAYRDVLPTVTVRVQTDEAWGKFRAAPVSVKAGLFRDGALVCWYEPEDPDTPMTGPLLFSRPETVLDPAGVYCEAVLIEDEYGRRRVWPGLPIVYDKEYRDGWRWPESWSFSSDPADWGL